MGHGGREGERIMPLNVIVNVKQVPDTQNITGDAMTPEGTVNRGALPAIVNPDDLCALEEALRIREQLGGTVTVISMGPPQAVEALRACVFRGADNAILVSDKALAASDTLATSYALASAINHTGAFDLVLCGRQAIDGDTAQVGPQLAEKLGINQVTNVIEVTVLTDTTICVKRGTERGYELLRTRFPALLTIAGSANQPRSPSARRLLAHKELTLQETPDLDPHGSRQFLLWNVDAIAADAERCGLAGSPTRVKKIMSVVLAADSLKSVPPTTEAIGELLSTLRHEHIIG